LASQLEAGTRQQQDWILMCMQGGRAHHLAACGVATLCCSPPGAAGNRILASCFAKPMCPRRPPASPHTPLQTRVHCQSMCSLHTDAARRTHRSRSVRHPALAACSRGVSERNVWSVCARAGSPQQLVRLSLRRLALPCTACLPSCLRCVAVRSSAGINSPRVLATINEVRKWQLTRLGRVGLRRG